MVGLGGRVVRGIVRALVLCAVLTVAAVVGLDVQRDRDGLPGSSVSPPVRSLPGEFRRLLDRHRCSTDGFAPGRPVAGAVVRRGGSIVHVTFEEGWEVYTSGARGTLVAVCLEAPRGGPQRL